MTTEPITMSTYTLESLSTEYNKVTFHFKSKKPLITDSDIRQFINQHPIMYAILRGLTH